ncbi:MAG TPA: FAD-dependent oxidoreductase [Acidimicrobiia bacterium]|nr:FAD-dependent oxidoreductase [Acidimicrobiia bacterium]
MPSVIVVGSGAAGLAAALAAAEGGADVLVLESAAAVGGTTALSGGVVWAPGHPYGAAPDDAADALTYLDAVAHGDADRTMLSTFVEDAGRVVRWLEASTPLRWELLADWPDYHSEFPGGRAGGRSIWPVRLTLPEEVAARVQRPAEPGVAPSPVGEGADKAMLFRGPVRGQALVGALLAGLRDRNVEVRTGVRADRLVSDERGVHGLVAGGERVDGRVVLATGGFQHDPGLRAAFLPPAAIAPLGTPGCAGHGLRMAMATGAALANMTEGWWMPAIAVPGEQLDGVQHYRPLHTERAQPGAIIVDRAGHRFVDEAQNYADVGRAMQRFDPSTYSFPASPCWLVFDARYRARYPFGPVTPGDPDPAWLARADDLDSLGEQLALPKGTLASTVVRFNDGARRGDDPDFGRGTRQYDRWIGDPGAAHPTLAPLADPPFYAAEVHLGCLGTKGGPRTDDRGRVLQLDGGPVAGLFAVGNAAASPFGIATPAGGCTIGPALVFGARAGEVAAG